MRKRPSEKKSKLRAEAVLIALAVFAAAVERRHGLGTGALVPAVVVQVEPAAGDVLGGVVAAVVASGQDLADLAVGAQVRRLALGGGSDDDARRFLLVRVAGVVDGQAVAAAPRVEAAGKVRVGRAHVHGLEAPGQAVEDVGALHAAV